MKTNNTEKTKILQSNSNFLMQLAFFVFEEHFVHVLLLKTELLVSTWGVPFAHFPLLHRDKDENMKKKVVLLTHLVVETHTYCAL